MDNTTNYLTDIVIALLFGDKIPDKDTFFKEHKENLDKFIKSN